MTISTVVIGYEVQNGYIESLTLKLPHKTVINRRCTFLSTTRLAEDGRDILDVKHLIELACNSKTPVKQAADSPPRSVFTPGSLRHLQEGKK